MSDIYYETKLGQLWKGDCLDKLKDIPDNSINLAVYDAPYKTTNIKEVGDKQWKSDDKYIEWCLEVITETQRVLKDNGSFYWFHNNPNIMTDILYKIKHDTKFILKNQITWSKINNWKSANIKDGAGTYRSILQCYGNQRSYNGSVTEYVYYFTFQDETGLNTIMLDVNNFSNMRKYFKELQEYIGVTKKELIEKIGQRVDHCFRWKSTQWDIPTKETYSDLVEIFNIDKWEGFKTYEELRLEYEDLRLEYEDLRYKFNQEEKIFKGKQIIDIREELKPHTTVWEYNRDNNIYGKHLTPKPLEMIKHIIEVSSSENDIVLDCFSGSGTLAVACENTNRKWICIEKDEDNDGNSLGYCDITIERLKGELK